MSVKVFGIDVSTIAHDLGTDAWRGEMAVRVLRDIGRDPTTIIRDLLATAKDSEAARDYDAIERAEVWLERNAA